MKAEEILKEIVKIEPGYASEMDGTTHCFYCGEWLDMGDDHTDNCPYVKAKELLESEHPS